MSRFDYEINSAWPPEAAFAYLADFSNIAEWDPNIERARRLEEDEVGRGSRFELVMDMPRQPRMSYELTEHSPPRKLVFEGGASFIRSTDTVTVEPAGAGCRVRWRADISLRGPAAVLAPLAGPTVVRRASDKAADGLRSKLSGPPPA